jgi:molybdate transport system ATP-binding protein
VLKIEGLRIELPEFSLRDIRLDIAEQDYFILVGPTGAGKTLLLETIAGLYPVKSGRILLANRDITSLEPEKRGVGIVYQDCALFPHLTVMENIAYGLRIKKTDKHNILSALKNISDTVGVKHLLDRKPATLSGGEKKKIALARALIVKPQLLLLDEPLSALDPENRELMREELKSLQDLLGITIIHVTHDFEEAISLGKHIAVLGNGEIKQVGTPEQIFREPNSEFVARFTLTQNIYTGVVENTDGYIKFTMRDKEFVVAKTTGEGHCFATIRPEEIIISKEPSQNGTINCFAGQVTRIADRGALISISVDIAPEITCIVTRRTFNETGLSTGQQVYVSFKPEAVHIISD